jgi:hypothetical protein
MCLTAIVGLINPFLACVDGLGVDRRELRSFHYLNANSGTLWPRLEFDEVNPDCLLWGSHSLALCDLLITLDQEYLRLADVYWRRRNARVRSS